LRRIDDFFTKMDEGGEKGEEEEGALQL